MFVCAFSFPSPVRNMEEKPQKENEIRRRKKTIKLQSLNKQIGCYLYFSYSLNINISIGARQNNCIANEMRTNVRRIFGTGFICVILWNNNNLCFSNRKPFILIERSQYTAIPRLRWNELKRIATVNINKLKFSIEMLISVQ